MFRKAVFAEVSCLLPPSVTSFHLTVFANSSAFKALDDDASIESFGSSVKEVLIVQAPVLELDQLTANIVNLQQPFLAREILLNRVYTELKSDGFVLLIAPPGSGKSKLLTLFEDRFPQLQCHKISFMNPNPPASLLVEYGGIDLEYYSTTLDPTCGYVVMIDDGHAKYEEDTNFWARLFTACPAFLRRNVSFIICASHPPEDAENSTRFASVKQLGRDDFLLSEDEAKQFLELPVLGLPERMRVDKLVNMMVQECNGLIGALRESVEAVRGDFDGNPDPQERGMIDFYRSQDWLHRLNGCFGSTLSKALTKELREFLIEWFVAPTRKVPCDPGQDKECWELLVKAGVLAENPNRIVTFSSLLAERYLCRCLFPKRATKNPTTLWELIKMVLGSMSPMVLRQSVVEESGNFPKEATFQHLFLEGLTRHTLPTCRVCPELSRVFPRSPSNATSRIPGEIDFYLNGKLRWGLELVVDGREIGAHMDRFHGKYKPLGLNDYAVIDLRGNKTGDPTNVKLLEKRISVFFKHDDFSFCKCLFELDKEIQIIALSED